MKGGARMLGPKQGHVAVRFAYAMQWFGERCRLCLPSVEPCSKRSHLEMKLDSKRTRVRLRQGMLPDNLHVNRNMLLDRVRFPSSTRRS